MAHIFLRFSFAKAVKPRSAFNKLPNKQGKCFVSVKKKKESETFFFLLLRINFSYISALFLHNFFAVSYEI